MRRVLIILVCLGISLIGYKAMVGPLLGQVLSSDPQPIPEPPMMAGMPYEKALEVVARQEKILQQVPGVIGASLGYDGIHIEVTVYTNEKGEKPATLPAELQALPKVIEGIPVVRISPIYVFPPPPGVLILKPGGKRERADTCPFGYSETSLHGWRFCVVPGNPEPIPGVMMLPIAGIPREEAFKILDRHRDELRALPGVGSVGMGGNGIYIEATDPSVLPKDVEGLPLDVHPRRPGHKKQFSHNLATTYRPVRGGIPFGVPGQAPAGTLGPIAFECGFWLIFPAHTLTSTQCNTTSACVDTLPRCFARYATTNPPVNQPFYPYVQTDQRIGQIVKWTASAPNTSVWDLAAAWIDNDVNQGNSSLCANRRIEQIGEWSGLDVDQTTLTLGQGLRVYTKNSPHTKKVLVESVDIAEPGVETDCGGGGFVTHLGQVTFTSPDRNLAHGDSGAPVLTLDGKFVAMFQWGEFDSQGRGVRGGGVMGKYIKSQLGFSKWYGTATFPNHPQVCQ